jgi:hypothetical protein
MNKDKKIEALEKKIKAHLDKYYKDIDELQCKIYDLSTENQSLKDIIQEKPLNRIRRLEEDNEMIKEKFWKSVRPACLELMYIDGNYECGRRRKLISGLDGCLCRVDNCYKIKQEE